MKRPCCLGVLLATTASATYDNIGAATAATALLRTYDGQNANSCSDWKLVHSSSDYTGLSPTWGPSPVGIYRVTNHQTIAASTKNLFIQDRLGQTGQVSGWNTRATTQADYPMCSTDGDSWKGLWAISSAKSGDSDEPALVGKHTSDTKAHTGGWMLLQGGATFAGGLYASTPNVHPCMVDCTGDIGCLRYTWACMSTGLPTETIAAPSPNTWDAAKSACEAQGMTLAHKADVCGASLSPLVSTRGDSSWIPVLDTADGATGEWMYVGQDWPNVSGDGNTLRACTLHHEWPSHGNALPAWSADASHMGSEVWCTSAARTLVTWTDAVNVDATTAGFLEKDGANDNEWDARAISTEALSASAEPQGVEFKCSADGRGAQMAGLGPLSSSEAEGPGTNSPYTAIEFAIYCAATLEVYEGGTKKGIYGPWGADDTFKVQVAGSPPTVTYLKNGVVFHTSDVVPAAFPLHVKTVIHSIGSQLIDVALYSSGALWEPPTGAPTAAPTDTPTAPPTATAPTAAPTDAPTAPACTDTPASTAAVGSTLRMHSDAGPAVAVDLLEDGTCPLPSSPNSRSLPTLSPPVNLPLPLVLSVPYHALAALVSPAVVLRRRPPLHQRQVPRGHPLQHLRRRRRGGAVRGESARGPGDRSGRPGRLAGCDARAYPADARAPQVPHHVRVHALQGRVGGEHCGALPAHRHGLFRARRRHVASGD
jgi:hypothetical protein